MHLKWTPEAQSDYDNVVDYLADSWPQKIVLRFVDKVDEVVRILLSNPLSGHLEPLLEGRRYQYRSIPIDGINRMVYAILGDVVIIVRIWDMRRNPETLKKGL